MKCCFCGKECGEYGNNPYPLSENENDKCCDDCNSNVITMRLISPERISSTLGITIGEAESRYQMYKNMLIERCKNGC